MRCRYAECYLLLLTGSRPWRYPFPQRSGAAARYAIFGDCEPPLIRAAADHRLARLNRNKIGPTDLRRRHRREGHGAPAPTCHGVAYEWKFGGKPIAASASFSNTKWSVVSVA